MTNKDLLNPKSPWASMLVCPESEVDDLVRRTGDQKGTLVRIVRGHRCQTKAALLQEWAAALQFPAYFGDNWDAFEDCLTDLDWLPGTKRVVVLTRAADVLPKGKADWRVFLDILHSAAQEWQARKGKGGLQFLFHAEPGEEQKLRARFQQAGKSIT